MTVNEQRLRIARDLANKHLQIDADVQEVYLIEEQIGRENGPNEPIKLLEIVSGTPEVGIEPIGFPPSPERGNCSVTIVEISPKEFDELGRRGMTFGKRSWKVSERLAPPEAIH